MTYASIDVSVQDGTPEYRILFTQGANEFRFTSRAEIVSDGINTWMPAAIKASAVTQSGEMSKDSVKMRMARTNTLAATFIGGAPDNVTFVTIFRSHIGDDVPQTYWKGRVSGFTISGDEVEIVCENIFSSLRRSGLRARYQKGCRHALYGSGCGVLKSAYEFDATATAASGLSVTFTLANNSNGPVSVASGYFTGGIMMAADGMRYISSHSGSTLILMQASNSLNTAIAGGPQPILLYPGCAHIISDCRDKFNNLINYGGFPWIPSKSPFNNNVTGSIT